MTWLIISLIVWALLTVGGFLLGNSAEGPGFGSIVAGTGFFLGLLIALPAMFYAQSQYNERTLQCHVTGKDRVGTGHGESEMRIYTKNCGTLVNKDMWFRGKTESADVYSKIEPGKTHTLHIVGWRQPITSDFPNILDVRK